MTPRSVRILLAEDNEDHRFLTVRALRDAAGVTLEIDTVADGEEAMQYLQSNRPDLIILDLKMPKVDGLEVLERVKSDPDRRAIPTVVLSSSDRPEDVSAAYRLGGNTYVTKPTSATGFRESMAQLRDYWTGLATLP